VKTHHLTTSAKEVIADAERLGKAYAAAGGFVGFADPAAQSRRERAFRSANIWALAGRAGAILALMGAIHG
jgi:hypothetical protein